MGFSLKKCYAQDRKILANIWHACLPGWYLFTWMIQVNRPTNNITEARLGSVMLNIKYWYSLNVIINIYILYQSCSLIFSRFVIADLILVMCLKYCDTIEWNMRPCAVVGQPRGVWPPTPPGYATGNVCQNYGDWCFRRFGAAEQDCTKAILLGTKDAKAWFRRGCARESLKRHSEALGDFEEVLKIDSRNKAALNKLESIRNVGILLLFP